IINDRFLDSDYVHTNYNFIFHLFPELENWQGGQSFQENEATQSKVKAHFASLAATFFKDGIGNQVYRYDKCLNFHGDYDKN
ncbi:hypothetical protein AVEN_246198-1, partial [Araneus ventricosus]